MEGVTVAKVSTMGKKPDYFIARHEERKVQFTGATEDEALDRMAEFLRANPAR